MKKSKFSMTPDDAWRIAHSTWYYEVVDDIMFFWLGNAIDAVWDYKNEDGDAKEKRFDISEIINGDPHSCIACSKESSIWTKIALGINEYFKDYQIDDCSH